MPDFVIDQFAGTGGSLTGLPRRYLVSVHHDGATTRTPVEPDEDVLNIERDLHHHLSEAPYSDAWLRDVMQAAGDAVAQHGRDAVYLQIQQNL